MLLALLTNNQLPIHQRKKQGAVRERLQHGVVLLLGLHAGVAAEETERAGGTRTARRAFLMKAFIRRISIVAQNLQIRKFLFLFRKMLGSKTFGKIRDRKPSVRSKTLSKIINLK